MRTLAVLGLLGALTLPAYAQDAACNPACASQPAVCCNIQSDTFLAEQCTGIGANLVHFVITDGTAWLDLRAPATFDVSGKTGTTTLGNSGAFSFTIGTSTASARFQIVDATLTPIGQCVGTQGDTYSLSFPAMIVADMRAVQASGRNPLYCREGGATPQDLLCFQVKGQVGPPFQASPLCAPDRVEYVCGVVH